MVWIHFQSWPGTWTWAWQNPKSLEISQNFKNFYKKSQPGFASGGHTRCYNPTTLIITNSTQWKTTVWILKKESNFTQLCQSWEKAFAKCHITISFGILTNFLKSQACPNWIKSKLNFCLQVCILTYNFSLESQEKCSTSQYYAILERNFSLEPQKKSSTSQ